MTPTELTLLSADALLVVRDLNVRFPAAGESGWVVRNVNLTLRPGETLGIVGESGSGKSLTALSINGLVPHPAIVSAAAMSFEGKELQGPSGRANRREIGTRIAMVFQNPLSSLTPSMRIGAQLVEGLRCHQRVSRAEARERALQALRDVQIAAPEKVLRLYPHQLSGGMRQRIVIAMGLIEGASLLIADEPTTALDATIQQQILRLLHNLKRERGLAMILISHDLGVIAEVCDRILVMYAGRIVEELSVADLARAAHPYTRALLAAVPTLEKDPGELLVTLPAASLAGEPGSGCAFAPRCPQAISLCREVAPQLFAFAGDGRRRVACWVANCHEAPAIERAST